MKPKPDDWPSQQTSKNEVLAIFITRKALLPIINRGTYSISLILRTIVANMRKSIGASGKADFGRARKSYEYGFLAKYRYTFIAKFTSLLFSSFER